MLNIENQILDISEVKYLALKLSKKLKLGDILMLKGDLGVGKTTFARFIVDNLYLLNNLKNSSIIGSPTYPILLTYDLKTFEIYHYDLYRIKNINELEELDFFENIENSLTLIEWPEILIHLPLKKNYYIINFDLYSETKRIVNIKYLDKSIWTFH